MRHVFHPEAADEFAEVVQYYKERGRNLGKRFSREVRVAIHKIVETPERWRILEEDVRRSLVRAGALHHRAGLHSHHRSHARQA